MNEVVVGGPDQATDPPYRAASNGFDECVDVNGTLREPWRAALAAIRSFGPDGIRARRHTAERLLTDTGAAHTMTEVSDPSGRSRVDPLPYVLSQDDWATLRAGIAQRIRLHDAVLTDLYGPRTLIVAGAVPVSAALGSRHFAPAAHGWVPTGTRLSRYSATVVRDLDGRFVVVGEHTDAAAGAGRALLGRAMLARTLPELYGSNVESLVGFFDTLRSTLASHAPPSAPNPRTVLLAPPSRDPTFVEHAYLAAQLGYTLVTAADLSVVRGRLALRAIGGLEPIDVIIRAVSIDDTDPLETSRHGTGVAGLVQVAREGAASLSNTIGSGLAESAALAPFTDAMCRHLLGETLILPSVLTLSCNDPDHAATVRANRDDFDLIEAIGALSATNPAAGDVEERFAKHPERFVAKRRVRQANVPVVSSDGTIVAGWASVVLHATFDGSTATVLPGGTATSAALGLAPMSKDVAVPAAPIARRPAPIAVTPIDLRSSLPSRAAEALFWTGRNAERAEFAARAVQTVLTYRTNDPSVVERGIETGRDSADSWSARAAAFLGAVTGLDKPDGHRSGADAVDDAVADAASDRRGALGDSLNYLLSGAATVREYLSGTTSLVTAALDADRLRLKTDTAPLTETIDHILVSLAALAGLTQESVVRGPSWQFLDLGRRWERAHLLMAGLRAALGGGVDDDMVGSIGQLVLSSNESLLAYRRRFRTDVEGSPMLELLLTDATNPRSLAFQLSRLSANVLDLPDRPGRGRCEVLVHQLTGSIAQAPDLATLAELAERVGDLLASLERAMVDTWFNSVVTRPTIAWS